MTGTCAVDGASPMVAASLGYILVFAGIGIKWFRWSTD